YTNELECKLSCLEEENKRLKREKGVGHVIEVRAPSRTEKTSSENEIDLILIVCRVQASGRF
uniref:Uncharacterized protein n=1 Tax=Aegilops tauschii subsp. strangulata TaxID=200361 RepID=A0A453KCQ6_AEGTS